MTKIIKIRRHGFVGERTDNMLSEFQPIWSRAAEMHVQLAYFFTFEKRRKTKIPRLSHQGRNCRGIPFLYNNRSVTVNMEQVQISRDGGWISALIGIGSFHFGIVYAIHDEPSLLRDSTFSIVFPWQKWLAETIDLPFNFVDFSSSISPASIVSCNCILRRLALISACSLASWSRSSSYSIFLGCKKTLCRFPVI